MARIAGVNIPNHKHIVIGLTAIFGIGRSLAQKICGQIGIVFSKKVKDLDDTELEKLREEVGKYMVEGNLHRVEAANLRRLKDINCYRGIRHRKGGLPVRGQRTRTNARTRKGPRRASIALKK